MDDIATAILWIFVAVPMIVEACSEAVFWSFVRMAAHGILEPSAFGMWFLLYWGRGWCCFQRSFLQFLLSLSIISHL